VNNLAIKEFARRYILKTRTDPDGCTIIPGRFGHLYQADNQQLAVLIEEHKWRWIRSRAKFLAAGCALLQNGDCEGTVSFDRLDPPQAKLVIKAVHAKKRRIVSPAQREQLARARQRLRRRGETTPKDAQ
jgi:hypothetical protein